MSVFGAFGGTTFCLAAGIIGAKGVLAAAHNDGQRQVLRHAFTWGGIYAATLAGLLYLLAFGVFPRWVYALAALLWFGPLLPALAWTHRRLDDAAVSETPVTALA